MKRYLVTIFCGAQLFTTWIPIDVNAQTASAEAQAHVAKAKAAAYRPDHDISDTFDAMCNPLKPGATQISGAPSQGPTTPRSKEPYAWWAPPAKVFDNLYYVGTSNQNNQSAWAVTTSDGIILIDSAYDYTVKELITNGFKKVGLDPEQIKYVILHHAHGDRYFGSKYLQDTYRARLVMSEADWNVIAKSNDPAELKPKKDMVATDGMKLTLGDTTLTLYITPGHTPGTLSTLVPLKDGNQRHLGYILGGRGAEMSDYGVPYFPDMATAMRTWIASIKRFHDVAQKAGADTFLSIHPQHDKTFDKLTALRFRKPGAPHPFVNKEFIENHVTVMTECMEAQLAWLKSGLN
jgi:metallo-beta-lactamase class B